MRRIVTAITAAALALSLVAQASPASAAVAGYDSSYAGESAFLTLRPGETGSFTVFFGNTGTTTWTRGTSTQVDLFACLADKVTCDVAPEESAWNPGTWTSSTRYATQIQTTIAPGGIATYTYNITVPAGTAAGDYDFNGDTGVSSVAGSAGRVHPEGYFQRVTVPVAAAAAITVTPSEAATNQVSTATGTNANRGARSYTATITGVTACVDIGLITQARLTSDNTRFRDDSDSDPGTAPFTQDNRADDFAGTSAVIEVVNGVATAGTDDFVDCVTVPSTGIVSFSIDSLVPGQDVKPVVFVDANNNNTVDLTGTADASGFRTPSEQFGVGGRKTWTAGTASAYAGTVYGTVCRKDSTASTFSLNTNDETAAPPVGALGPATAGAGATAGSQTVDTSPSASQCDVTYAYDANDNFFDEGVPISQATFTAELSRGDVVAAGPYSDEASASSTFNISNDSPDAATVSCTTSTGAATDDVRLSIDPTQPEMSSSTNVYSSWAIQRRLSAQTPEASFVTIATPTTDAEAGSTSSFEYSDADVASGTYDYRVRGIVDGDTADNAYTPPASGGCTIAVATPGAAGTAPLSTDTFVSTSGGLTGELDTGDIIKIVFDQVMNPDSTGDVIKVQDADGTTMTIRCSAVDGAGNSPVGEYQAICNFNAAIETVKGSPQDPNRVLTVTIHDFTLPAATGPAGTTAGMQLPSTIVDQGGVVSASPNNIQWNVTGSPDRVVDVE